MATQRMKQVQVTWVKSLSVTVFAPEDMSDEDIERLAQRTADTIDREWFPPDEWETVLTSVSTVEVSDTERTVETKRNKFGYPCLVVRGRFDNEEACAVSDDRKKMVNMTDAKWWMHLSDEGEPAPEERRA
jgi:hypothetical protein